MPCTSTSTSSVGQWGYMLFRVQGLGRRVLSLGLGFGVEGVGFRV